MLLPKFWWELRCVTLNLDPFLKCVYNGVEQFILIAKFFSKYSCY